MSDFRKLWQRARPHIVVFDTTLATTIAIIAAISLVTMYSAAHDFPGRFEGHARNLLIAVGVMWLAANVPPSWMMNTWLVLSCISEPRCRPRLAMTIRPSSSMMRASRWCSMMRNARTRCRN